jgi:hypothetical protein
LRKFTQELKTSDSNSTAKTVSRVPSLSNRKKSSNRCFGKVVGRNETINYEHEIRNEEGRRNGCEKEQD